MQDANSSAYAVHSRSDHNEANTSGVSWAAVFAGALAVGALYLILLSLGAGLGLSSVSPWSGEGLSSSAVGTSAILWLIVTEFISSAMGGYLAGRLRTKWAGIHSDEVYFRDTAHGFLAWCTALVFTAAFLASAATTLLGHSVSSKTSETTQASSQTASAESYFVDRLFRTGTSKSEAPGGSARAETSVIFAKALTQGSLAADDKAYLEQLVSAQTEISGAEASNRVSTVFADAQQSAEAARKAVAHSLLWMFIALLIGAFTASFFATIGGRQRDHVVLI